MSSASEFELEWWGPETVPAPGALVWCHFPDHLFPEKPAPKPRPALVFKVRYVDNPPADRFYVMVAYGTSKLKLGKRPNDFIIANSMNLDIVRLPQATRFDLDNIIWIPWAKPFFVPREPEKRYATPVISTLPAEIKSSLQWTMARRDLRGLNTAYHSARTIEADDAPQADPAQIP